MAWGQPKRNGKNACGHHGQCSCQRRNSVELRNNPAAAPRTCTKICQRDRGKHAACGATIRGGVCPCPSC